MRKAILIVLISILFLPIFTFSDENTDGEIELLPPDTSGGKSLMEALMARKTSRNFDPSRKLQDQTLSNLLWAAFGVNRPESGKRTAPSAVDWREIDVYVALEKGLYLYDAPEHVLKLVLPQDIRDITGRQDFTGDAPVNLIYVADFKKMSGSQSNKEFYSAADTGFISQNVYLFCASEGLATVVIGMIDKGVLKKTMGLRSDQHVILAQPVGYPLTEIEE